MFAVNSYFICFGVDVDLWGLTVELQISLGQIAHILGFCHRTAQTETLRDAVFQRGRWQEGERRIVYGTAHRPEVIAHGARLRGRNRTVRIAHQGLGYLAALDNQLRFDAEERRIPEHQVRE